MPRMPPESLFPHPVLLPMATRSSRVLSNRVSEASAATEASVAPTLLDSEASTAPTMLDFEEAGGEAAMEQGGIAFPAGTPQPPQGAGSLNALAAASGSAPRAARSRSPRRPLAGPPAAPPQTARIISPGLLPVLPIITQLAHGPEPPGDPEDPFAEEPPWGNLMNGSVMDEPHVPPQQPRRVREPALLLVAPAAPELLPMHFGAIGAQMGIGAAVRDAFVGTSHLAATALRISSDPRSIEEGWRHASSHIRELATHGMAFYIGITENPARRWEDHCQTAPWDDMEILIEAPSSRVTGDLEHRLIGRFRPVIGCTNVGPGGECRSAGCPHFLYVLVRQSGLLRRSY